MSPKVPGAAFARQQKAFKRKVLFRRISALTLAAVAIRGARNDGQLPSDHSTEDVATACEAMATALGEKLDQLNAT